MYVCIYAYLGEVPYHGMYPFVLTVGEFDLLSRSSSTMTVACTVYTYLCGLVHFACVSRGYFSYEFALCHLVSSVPSDRKQKAQISQQKEKQP